MREKDAIYAWCAKKDVIYKGKVCQIIGLGSREGYYRLSTGKVVQPKEIKRGYKTWIEEQREKAEALPLETKNSILAWMKSEGEMKGLNLGEAAQKLNIDQDVFLMFAAMLERKYMKKVNYKYMDFPEKLEK
jgi:hypothetical protein